MRLAESQALVGYVCFHREGEAYDLGYCFHSAYQGQGYAWESVSALLEYLASQGAAVFTAGTALDNLPSRRLLERLALRWFPPSKSPLWKTSPFWAAASAWKKT